MQIFKYTKVGMAIRIILLTISGLAIFTFYVWICAPSLVYRIDNYIVENYFKHYEKRLQEAENIIQTDKNKGIMLLESLIYDLSEIKINDNLCKIKRRVFFDLVNSARSTDHEKSLFWADQWIKFDDKDMTAKISKAYILYTFPETRTIGISYIEKLHNKHPDIPIIQEAYAAIKTNQAK